MELTIPIAKITRIAVFVHPGQLESGVVFLITLHDGERDFEAALKRWKSDPKAICVYDGPPNGGKK